MVYFIEKYLVLKLLRRCSPSRTFRVSQTVNRQASSLRVYSTLQKPDIEEPSILQNVQTNKISKAVQAYRKRAEEYETFMKQQLEEYESGKKFLAKMMGRDPETFTQKDIDESIEYLLPSALYEPLARPMFKHPNVLYPKIKGAEFDKTGRPYNFLYYTGKPNYSQLLHDCATYIDRLNNKTRGKPRTSSMIRPINVIGTNWISKQDLEKMLLEKILDVEYTKFIEAMDRLVECPYSFEYADFIMKYRISVIANLEADTIPTPILREDGRRSTTTRKCIRKKSIGEVTVIYPGTGKITINNQGIDYFKEIQAREQPFLNLFLDMLMA